MKIDRLDRAPQKAKGVRMPRPAVAPRTLLKKTLTRWSAAIVLAMLFGLPWLLPLPRHELAVDIGAEVGLNEFGESRAGFYLFDINPPEQDPINGTYRWTRSFSTLRFLNLFAVGSPLLLKLRACDCRPAGTAPATSTLKLNSAAPLPLPLDGRFRTYHILVPHELSDYGNDLYFEFQGNTFQLPNDDRQLGIRLDRVSTTPIGPAWSLFGLPSLATWLLYALLVGGTWLVATDDRRLENRKQGRSTLIVSFWSIFVAAVLLGLPYVYRPQIFMPLLLALLCVAAIWGALLVGRSELHRLVLACAGLWMVGSIQKLGFWILDDAYISFRYAANLLAGHGLVFNVGERVEGYTNFLWTMIMAVPLAWGLDPTLPASVLTLLIGLGVVWLVYRWGSEEPRTENQEPSDTDRFSVLGSLFAPLLLALSTPFLLYTARGSGMETALFTLLLVAGSLVVQRATSRRELLIAGILLAFATMTRPDGVLGVAAASLYLLLRYFTQAKDERRTTHLHNANFRPADKQFLSLWKDRNRLSGDRASVSSFTLHPSSFILGFIALFAPYYTWRYWYYGYPLPNTFYAKVGSGWTQVQRGLDYAGSFAATVGWRFVALILLLGLAAAWWQWRRAVGSRRSAVGGAEIVHLVALVGLYSAYTVYVGGDHFPGFRFFVPILPFLALLMQHALGALAQIQTPISTATAGKDVPAPSRPFADQFKSLVSSLAALGLGALYLAFTAYQLPASDIGIGWSTVRGEYNVVEKNRELGLWLRDNAPPDTVVATGIAGALPFYSGLKVIDTLGLNDVHIAHLDVAEMGAGVAGAEKTDVPYVLDQRPEYIPYSTSGTFQGYPRFKSDYDLIEVRGPEGRAIKLYRRHDEMK